MPSHLRELLFCTQYSQTPPSSSNWITVFVPENGCPAFYPPRVSRWSTFLVITFLLKPSLESNWELVLIDRSSHPNRTTRRPCRMRIFEALLTILFRQTILHTARDPLRLLSKHRLS